MTSIVIVRKIDLFVEFSGTVISNYLSSPDTLGRFTNTNLYTIFEMDVGVDPLTAVPVDNGSGIEITIPQEAIDNVVTAKVNTIRSQRDILLSDTDWTQAIDGPVSIKVEPYLTQFREYRQALRDLPTTVDVNNVIFPTLPEFP